MTACLDFVSRLGPNGEFVQVTDHLSALDDDPAVAEENMPEMQRILRILEDIVRYKEFAIANLRSR